MVKVFARYFWFFKNILLQPSRTYFHFYKKGFLISQAVRIRVKDLDIMYCIPILYIIYSLFIWYEFVSDIRV
jgi:hypothetical protein